jgi:hypothetical protein
MGMSHLPAQPVRTDIVAPVNEDGWQLWRQDDNANRYPMKTFDDRLAALAEALVFTARGHRQLYEVVGPPGPALRTNADLYDLCKRIPDRTGGRDLRTYLLTLYRLGTAVSTQKTLVPEVPPVVALPVLGWDTLIDFAWAGQSYE